MSLPPESEPSPSQPVALARRLGLAVAVAVVVGNVIGSGIFLKPGTIAAQAGRFDLIISVWIFGGIFCLLGALCFAELGTMFPEAGGLYAYLREAFGPRLAFLFGWNEFLFNKPAGIAALSVAFTSSLASILHWKIGPWQQVGLIAAVIAWLGWINILGVHWGGRMQLATTVVKVLNIVAIVALPFVMMLMGRTGIDAANYATTSIPLQPTLLSQVSVALLAVMWAYNGWHGLAPMAEEIREPQRNIPRALFYGIGILTLLYVSANVAYHGVLSMSALAAAGDDGAKAMLVRLLGDVGGTIMDVIIMCSTFGAISATLLEAPRVSFAMGRDRVFFRGLGLVHAKYRTPAIAIVVAALMSVVAAASAAGGKQLVADWDAASVNGSFARKIVENLQSDSIFDMLTNFVVFGSAVFFVLAVLAVFILRRQRPDHPRPYRTWGYPWTPLAFLAFNAFFLWQVYWSQPLESGLGLVLIGLGLPVFSVFSWRRARSEGSLRT